MKAERTLRKWVILICVMLFLSCHLPGHPGGFLHLKGSNDVYKTYERENFSLKLRLDHFAYSEIGVTVYVESKDTLILNPYNLKIFSLGADLGYRCKINGKRPKYSNSLVGIGNTTIMYSSIPLLGLQENQEVEIFAEKYIFDRKEYFDIDTLTFIVR